MKKKFLSGARALAYKSLSTLTLDPCMIKDYINEALVSLALSFKVMSDFNLEVAPIIRKLEDLAGLYDWGFSGEFEKRLCIEHKACFEAGCQFKERFYTKMGFEDLMRDLQSSYSRVGYSYNRDADELGVELGFMEKTAELEYEYALQHRYRDALDVIYIERNMLKKHIIPFSKSLIDCISKAEGGVYRVILNIALNYTLIDEGLLENLSREYEKYA